VRQIVRQAQRNNFRFSSLIEGIAGSPSFQMQESPMIITKKALPRRALLRGMGATLALPLLDAMAPGVERGGGAGARLGYVYMPMGAHIAEWTPLGAQPAARCSPTLRSLAPGGGLRLGAEQYGAAERFRGRMRRRTRRF
jgi:hypothetical protein